MTMLFHEFAELVNANPDAQLTWELPDQSQVPVHYHVTEVGVVQKRFVDCGGTVRTNETAILQLWVDSDIDHRLVANKLSGILSKADAKFAVSQLPIAIEYNMPWLTQMPIVSGRLVGDRLWMKLEARSTDCLAKEVCCVGTDCCTDESPSNDTILITPTLISIDSCPPRPASGRGAGGEGLDDD
jgi:hypothetical protein